MTSIGTSLPHSGWIKNRLTFDAGEMWKTVHRLNEDFYDVYTDYFEGLFMNKSIFINDIHGKIVDVVFEEEVKGGIDPVYGIKFFVAPYTDSDISAIAGGFRTFLIDKNHIQCDHSFKITHGIRIQDVEIYI